MDKIAFIIIGLFFIGLGFMLHKWPMLISGYNTMPKEQRDKIDIKAIARIMRACFAGMGGILIVMPFLFDLIGLSSWKDSLLLVVVFGGIAIMMVLVNMNPSVRAIVHTKAQKITFLVVILFLLLIFGGLYKTAQPAHITVANNRLVIEGSYGISIPLEQIKEVEVTNTAPSMDYRRNGLSFSRYHKGHFHSKEKGAHLLFLHSGQPPYLIITTEKNQRIVINRSTPEEIYQLEQQIKRD
ncbi:hypothetical protein M2137_000676 [Parabacteroides sp. PFB2-10]|uniref:DUF3784 domain-containing protein n=1 Tax=Parabacteroides sp. PFB2-10 TaxID=1742405 RepID=UPI002473B8FE|nr:DUF3784 domain-containing protein [Parabacteroides sp. PFB2-10]MDH6311917.1 hypothetical protein [Parabacteroides sp. PFB2-10]